MGKGYPRLRGASGVGLCSGHHHTHIKRFSTFGSGDELYTSPFYYSPFYLMVIAIVKQYIAKSDPIWCIAYICPQYSQSQFSDHVLTCRPKEHSYATSRKAED